MNTSGAQHCPGFTKRTAILVIVVLLVFYATHMLTTNTPDEELNNKLAVASLLSINKTLYAYAKDQDREFFPPVCSYPGMWVPDLRLLYPKYLDNPDVLVSPLLPRATMWRRELRKALSEKPPNWEAAHRIAAQSILYTGYALQLEADLEHFIGAGMPRKDENITLAGQKLFRLQNGIERFFLPEHLIRTAVIIQPAPIFYIMEQPALAQRRETAGLYVAGYGERGICFIPFGAAFPAVELTKIAFPPPNL